MDTSPASQGMSAAAPIKGNRETSKGNAELAKYAESQKVKGATATVAVSDAKTTGNSNCNTAKGDEEIYDDRPFKCTHCSKAFRQKGHLVYHLHTHSSSYDYKCDVCSEEFNTPARLFRHQRSEHQKQVAGQNVDIYQEFKVNEQGMRKTYTCRKCGKCFTHLHSARTHSWMHSGTKPYKCEKCNKSFRQSGHLICHMVEFHSKTSEPRVCLICSREFRTRGSLTKHISMSHGKLILKKSGSKKNASVKKETNEILNTEPDSSKTQTQSHNGSRLWKTSSRKLSSSSGLANSGVGTGGDNVVKDGDTPAIGSGSSLVKGVGDSKDEQNLEARSDVDEEEDSNEQEEAYMQDLGETILVLPGDNSIDSKTMMKIKEKGFSLQNNGGNGNMLIHRYNASNQTGEVPEDTEHLSDHSSDCLGDSAETVEESRKNVIRNSQETAVNDCTALGSMSYSYSPEILNDKRNIIIKMVGRKRRFECVACKKVFDHSQSATNHSLIHTGAKPFRCNFCFQMFRQRAHVLYHMHKHTGTKLFQCDFCGTKFASSTVLRRHAREVHGLDKQALDDMIEPKRALVKSLGKSNEAMRMSLRDRSTLKPPSSELDYVQDSENEDDAMETNFNALSANLNSDGANVILSGVNLKGSNPVVSPPTNRKSHDEMSPSYERIVYVGGKANDLELARNAGTWKTVQTRLSQQEEPGRAADRSDDENDSVEMDGTFGTKRDNNTEITPNCEMRTVIVRQKELKKNDFAFCSMVPPSELKSRRADHVESTSFEEPMASEVITARSGNGSVEKDQTRKKVFIHVFLGSPYPPICAIAPTSPVIRGKSIFTFSATVYLNRQQKHCFVIGLQFVSN